MARRGEVDSSNSFVRRDSPPSIPNIPVSTEEVRYAPKMDTHAEKKSKSLTGFGGA